MIAMATIEIRLPHNWKPRPYQRKLWKYLRQGGKRAVAVWHRRAGKDDVCLHWTCIAAHKRIGNYWHMLPEAAQARKAIWEAVNPHTGIRRIDEAFPVGLRQTTRENEMLIRFLNGSTWQVVGSDNFNSLVGSPPVGVIFSEWSMANPTAWSYIRPILAENGGWALFIYTPRGKNHGHSTFTLADESPDWFGQRLTVDDTCAIDHKVLAQELYEYIKELGPEMGRSMFEQEYYCSFEAAVIGSVYGAAMARMGKSGRIKSDLYDAALLVHTGWDLGRSDATVVTFFQVVLNEIRLIDCYDITGDATGPDAMALMLKERAKERGYRYGTHWLPHDGGYKLQVANGRSFMELLQDRGITRTQGFGNLKIVPATNHTTSHNATRAMLEKTWIDANTCAALIEALKQYHFKWDEDLKRLSKDPVHDGSSHFADSVEIISRVWQSPVEENETPQPRFLRDLKADEVFWPERYRQKGAERI